VVILGNDAQLAARPATPVQLAHACLAAGYRAVIPASWGDELVASATLAALRDRTIRPSIQCACPHVARRVLGAGSELAPHLVSLVAPPVAAARYLRVHSDVDLRIAYVGRCPAAADDSIDARLTPEELLAQLGDRGIEVAAQPEVFESVIPPDRRRHLSLPGGLPAPETLWSRNRMTVETMKTGDFAAELAHLVLGRADALIDAAPLVGCACSGAVRGVEVEAARLTVVALEPPRSAHPIIDDAGALSLELRLPALARNEFDLLAEQGTMRGAAPVAPAATEALGDAPPPPPAVPNRRPRLTPPGIAAIGAASPPPPPAGTPPRRRSPIGTPRVVPGAVPVSSDSEGRVLPRAYVARRRSPRAGVPVVSDTAPARTPSPAADAPPPRPAQRHTVPDQRGPEPTPAAVESERPVSRSVEPTPPPATPPATSTAALVPAMAATLGRSVAALRRSWVVIACAIAGTGLLLGAAIGYAFAHRGTTAAATTGAPDSSVSSATQPAGSTGVRESVSAGGIAPVPNAARGATRRTPVRAQERGTTGRERPPAVVRPPSTASPRSSIAQPPAASPSPAATLPAPLTPAPADSARAAARRDSVARTESLVAERDAIRREIEMRRARMDSIERARRRIDSLQRAQLPPPPDR